MPSLTLDTSRLTFFYSDSGHPTCDEYTTLVIVHGHTFHSGIFQRLLPLAASRSLRLICVNRRGYPGSTAYTLDELRVLVEGSGTDCAELVAQGGVDLALFVDGLIRECSLSRAGCVVLLGWSLGNASVLSIIASITSLPTSTRERLQSHIREFILWDIPVDAIGIQGPPGLYVPLFDEEIPPEARGLAFAKWVSSYFNHGHLASRDPTLFGCRNADALKKPSVANMTPEEYLSVTDAEPGNKYDTPLSDPPFARVLAAQTQKALLDPGVRDAWYDAKVCVMYADKSPWSNIYSAWILEDGVTSAQCRDRLTIHFKVIEEANHFLMWDEPERMISVLEDYTKL